MILQYSDLIAPVLEGAIRRLPRELCTGVPYFLSSTALCGPILSQEKMQESENKRKILPKGRKPGLSVAGMDTLIATEGGHRPALR